ncbi:MAG: ribonuclease HII [Pseudomonadota bacterium]
MVADTAREDALRALGYHRIVGIDEVGRGPWAGPVVVAGVILNPADIPDGLADSKTLSASKRELLRTQILASATTKIVEVPVEVIDQMNILAASLLGMRQVAQTLAADFALIDGNKIPTDLPCPAEAVIKGDSKSASIAAASIIAKVYRDELMADLADDFPGYGWETNAGYGTKMHQSALQNLGVTPHHRRSFKPIHNILYGDGAS